MNRRFQVLMAPVLMTLIAGCGFGGSGVSLPPQPALIISPKSVSVLPGAIVQLKAVVSNIGNHTVLWSIDEGAAGGSISSQGLYTAPAALGTFHITASLQAKPTVMAAATVAVASSVTRYSIVDLGSLPNAPVDGVIIQPKAINAAGQVVGYTQQFGNGFGSSYTETLHAFLYSSGGMKDLGTLGGPITAATAINTSGQIVGYSAIPTTLKPPNVGPSHAFLYQNGAMQDLGVLPGYATSQATGISDAGVIVGYCTDQTGNYRAFEYSNGVMSDLGVLPGDQYSQANGINGSGQIVGFSQTAGGPAHAFLVTGGQMQSLGSLSGYVDSRATSINSKGQIVGTLYASASSVGGVPNLFLWSNGVMKNLGYAGYPQQINAAGQIAAGGGNQSAFVFTAGALQDLNALLPANSGWQLTAANAISDAGQIVGTGTNGNGNTHGFLMTPQ